MELTIKALLNSRGALATLGNTKGLQSVVAYRIAKNIKAINAELETYEETRVNLVKEYAKKDKDGNPLKKETNGNEVYDIEDEKMEELNKEINRLMDETVEIDIKKISLDDLNNAGLSAFELEAVEFMLDID